MLIKDKVLKGRYRIIDRLGDGASSQVYEAYDSIRKANVALKEILIDSEKIPAINARESLKRAFADRAKMLAEVKHEALPQVRGYFSEFDRQYLVVELINGDNAEILLSKNEKPISFSNAANWADQLLDVLDYLHTLPTPIIHGDIKPQNVKLNSRGRIKLLGLDITESLEAKLQTIVVAQPPDGKNSPYLSLEQLLRVVYLKYRNEFTESDKEKSKKFLKQTADARSDIYSLGATLYHLTTGQTPVDALERTLAVWSEEFDPLPTAHELNSSIPPEVSAVLMKALEIEPEKRFGSAIEMRQSLQTAITRAQEREAEKDRTQATAAALETLLAEEKRLEQERQSVEQERLRLEEERQKQVASVAQQLKAAEIERVKAERRAAEVERQLQEKKTRNHDETKASDVFKQAADSPQKTLDADALPPAGKSSPTFIESEGLFADSIERKKSAWLMPTVAVIILLLGGAAAGVWILQSPKNIAAESNQPVVNQIPAAIEKAATPTETQTPSVEKISPLGMPAPSVEPISAEKTLNQPATKIKPITQPVVQPATRSVKSVTAPKTAANQKKTVTVDDLINN